MQISEKAVGYIMAYREAGDAWFKNFSGGEKEDKKLELAYQEAKTRLANTIDVEYGNLTKRS